MDIEEFKKFWLLISGDSPGKSTIKYWTSKLAIYNSFNINYRNGIVVPIIFVKLSDDITDAGNSKKIL